MEAKWAEVREALWSLGFIRGQTGGPSKNACTLNQEIKTRSPTTKEMAMATVNRLRGNVVTGGLWPPELFRLGYSNNIHQCSVD
jgi:hypothetical protein